jgi:hypothetical protein
MNIANTQWDLGAATGSTPDEGTKDDSSSTVGNDALGDMNPNWYTKWEESEANSASRMVSRTKLYLLLGAISLPLVTALLS